MQPSPGIMPCSSNTGSSSPCGLPCCFQGASSRRFATPTAHCNQIVKDQTTGRRQRHRAVVQKPRSGEEYPSAAVLEAGTLGPPASGLEKATGGSRAFCFKAAAESIAKLSRGRPLGDPAADRPCYGPARPLQTPNGRPGVDGETPSAEFSFFALRPPVPVVAVFPRVSVRAIRCRTPPRAESSGGFSATVRLGLSTGPPFPS